GALRRRRRQERLAHDAEHPLALAFGNGHKAAEVEARELDAAGRADDREAEVRQEVAREDRLVHLEPLVRRVARVVAVRERLERTGAPVASLADRGEEERLHHPRLRRVDEICARDEDGVFARRAGGKFSGPGKEAARAVLHRAEQPAVVVVVDRPPRGPLFLGATDPLPLVDTPVAGRLPEDAFVTHGGSRLERRAREADDAGHGVGPIRSTTTSTAATSSSAIWCRYSRTRC